MRQQHPGNQNRLAVVQSSGGDGKDGIGALARDSLVPSTATMTAGVVAPKWKDARLPTGLGHPEHRNRAVHKHPGDYRHIADTLDLIRHARQAFSSQPIIDVEGRSIMSLLSGSSA
jgi:hypothetical protein